MTSLRSFPPMTTWRSAKRLVVTLEVIWSVGVGVVSEFAVDEVAQCARVVRKVEFDGQLAEVIKINRLLISLKD